MTPPSVTCQKAAWAEGSWQVDNPSTQQCPLNVFLPTRQFARHWDNQVMLPTLYRQALQEAQIPSPFEHRSCPYLAVQVKRWIGSNLLLLMALCHQIWTGWYRYETLMQMDTDSRDTKAQVKPGHTFPFHMYTENGQPGIKSNMSIDVHSFTKTWVQNSTAACRNLQINWRVQ